MRQIRSRAFGIPPLLAKVGLVWLVAVALTAAFTLWLQQREDAAMRAHFDEEVLRVTESLERAFTLPVYGLMGARGVYAASDTVTRDEFRRYVESRDIKQEFPGILGIGFIERVDRSQLDAFVTRERADGWPDFEVRAAGLVQTDDLYIIKYIEPSARNRQAIGLELGSEPNRRFGIELAVRTGRPAMSRPINLVQDTQIRPGFLVLVPVFHQGAALDTPEEREAALFGLAYAPVVLEELLASRLEDLVLSQLNIRFVDRASPTREPLFQIGAESLRPQLTVDVPLNALQSELMIQLRSTPALEAMAKPGWIYLTGAMGLVLSTLMCWVLWLLLSGRSRAEALAASLTADLQKLALVAERTANSVIMTDANLRINWVNQGFTTITGYTLEEAQGRTPGELLSSGKADPRVLQVLQNSAERGERCRVEILNRTKDGREYWVDTEVQPIRGDNGELQGFIEIGLDVTHARDVQSQLQLAVQVSEEQKEQLDFLARVARATTNAVILADTQGRIQWVNDGFTRITGYTADEAMGRKPGEFLQCPDTDPATIQALAQAVANRQPCKVEILNQSKTGEQYWLELELQPLTDALGQHTGFMAIESDITERRNAIEELQLTQRQLQSQKRRLDNILDGTRAGTWEWHVPSGQAVFNQRWAEMLGYQLEDLEPFSIDTWIRFLQPEDFNKVRELLQRHFTRELDYFGTEARIRHRDGHWLWVMYRGQVADWNEDGSPGWMYGTQQDISDRKYAEIALRTSERRQRTLSALSAQWFWETDVEHRFIRFDSGDPQRLAQLNAKAIGKRRWEMTTEPVNTTWDMHKELLERREQFINLVYRRTESDGVLSYWSVSGAPWYDDDGAFQGYVGIGSDITQSKEAELRLARSEAMLERTGELAKVGGWSIDLTTGVPQWSAQTCRIHEVPVGYQPTMDEALSFYPPEARQVITQLVEHGLQSGEGWDVDLPFITATGRHLWVRTFGQVEMLGGQPTAIVGGFQDITEQRAAADELREAKRAAEQASQSKSQFLASMSHEIRTPMNAILGMLQLLHTTPLQPRQLDYVEKTQGAAKSLLGLLNDILDFSKVEAGKMTLEPQPFELDKLLRDLAVIFSANVGSKPVEVLFDIDPQVPRRLVGDTLRLQQVLINLGGNAIKFTPQGEVVLRLQYRGTIGEASGQPQACIRFEVQDSGIGIAPENQHKIFAGFTQAEASTTRRFGGTGLGLAISRRLIELMGGTLELDSALGRGSTFAFNLNLPLAAGAAEAAEVAADSHKVTMANPTAPWYRPGLSVLVVDDNPIARELMVRMGQTLGWAVESVADGQTALQLIETRQQAGTPFEVLYIDWQMDGMDGWTLASQVKTRFHGSVQAPVIMMVTGHGREMLVSQTPEVQSLIDGYLVKPVTASMLFDALQSAHHTDESYASKDAKAPNAVRRPLAGLKILVVEDNAINQQVAEELLSGQGALVDLADNGQRGVEAIETSLSKGKPYDVVLMDMQMPVMDGLEAAYHIRQRLQLHHLPIIAMTANAMASDREDCLKAGMNDHIAKPFDLDHLVAMLLNWTQGDARGSQAVEGSVDTSVEGRRAAALDDVPVLDTVGALQRVGGSASLLRRMGTQFLSDLPQLLSACEYGFKSSDSKALQRAMHTLKGVASTLGAERLAETARRQEDACLLGEPNDMSTLLAVAAETRQALLDSGVPSPADELSTSTGASSTPLTITEAEAELLQEMYRLLKASDLAVLDVKDQLTSQATDGETRWATLKDAVESMDFERAKTIVEMTLKPS